MRLGSGERFHTPTSPRLAVPPYLRLPVSPAPRFPGSPTRCPFPSSIHQHPHNQAAPPRHEHQHEPSNT
jgi:hypothetical protein